MHNPWEEIDLADYEKHMSLENVFQLQTMNKMMKEQFNLYSAKTVMILGIAGGNGLEHINTQSFDRVYGVDINKDYLTACSNRYPKLKAVFRTINTDLTQANIQLPCADLLQANLLIEYIGYECFQQTVRQVNPMYVTCIIQANNDRSFVSDSPYLCVFKHLDAVHHEIDVNTLMNSMDEIGYKKGLQTEFPLPNKKRLIRIDFIC